MSIPIFTLQRQNENLKKQFEEVFREIQWKGIYILGKRVAAFESEFAKYLGMKYAVGVASGTDAISLALTAVDIKSGDEVILPANAYPTAFAVTAVGARPVLVDISPSTFNIDPSMIKKAITKRTKAVVAVHLYGQAADLERIMQITKRHKLALIEDCAQAHGAEVAIQSHPGGVKHTPRVNIEWRKVGTVGEVGCFSFYPTKNLGCFGDGGMVVTNNEEIYKKVKLLRMYGEETRYKSVVLGRNSRLDELQAAILLIKLKYLNKWNERRKDIAKQYNFQFSIFNFQKNLILPFEAEFARHVYHLYVVRSKRRDKLKEYLEKKGIQTAVHYPKPIHFHPAFRYLGYKQGDFPESERACREVLSLPMFPELTDREVGYVAETINVFQKTE